MISMRESNRGVDGSLAMCHSLAMEKFEQTNQGTVGEIEATRQNRHRDGHMRGE